MRRPSPAQAALHKRAKEAEKAWLARLPKHLRNTLRAPTRSEWAHHGGNIIVANPPPTKRQMRQRRAREHLKRQREALLRFERAAYAARMKQEDPTA
jgi:hypothetical protein